MAPGDPNFENTPPNEGSESARRLVLNPTSGDREHVERVRQLADEYGFPIVETERAGHATDLAAAAAADGVDLLAVCGGDGTIHEAVQGLFAADALDAVTLCVLPGGTANIYASGLGIETLREGFLAVERGATRRLDLGMAGDEPFVLSAIAGLPAEASVSTSSDRKTRLGTFAFVVEGLRIARQFDGLRVAVDPVSDDDTNSWQGEALCLFIGVLRRFTGDNEPSNAENGRLEVTIVERVPPTDALAEVFERRLFSRKTPHVTTLEPSALDVVSLDEDPVRFSLDGELREFESVAVGLRPKALRVCVGAAHAEQS